MQTNNRILDDLAKVANGAVSTLVGVKTEVEASVRQQLEKLLVDMDLVARDEFEAMKAVAIAARTGQEQLEKRVAVLEAALANQSPAKSKTSAKKPATKRPARKPAKA